MREDHSQEVMGRGEKLSIWFFCGVLMLADGVVLLGQGSFEHFGHAPATVLSRLQPTLWWGLLLTVLGGVYTVRFRPTRGRSAN
jgi:drug/metabolite transporter (DMT)-like permease